MSDNSVYAIEFLRPDGIYSVDLAQRLLTADEYIVLEKEQQEEYIRQHPSLPLSDAERFVLKEGGLSLESPNVTDPSSWNGWMFYENLEGQHVAVPPGITPTVTQLEREAVPDYLESRMERLEESLEQVNRLYERYDNLERERNNRILGC